MTHSSSAPPSDDPAPPPLHPLPPAPVPRRPAPILASRTSPRPSHGSSEPTPESTGEPSRRVAPTRPVQPPSTALSPPDSRRLPSSATQPLPTRVMPSPTLPPPQQRAPGLGGESARAGEARGPTLPPLRHTFPRTAPPHAGRGQPLDSLEDAHEEDSQGEEEESESEWVYDPDHTLREPRPAPSLALPLSPSPRTLLPPSPRTRLVSPRASSPPPYPASDTEIEAPLASPRGVREVLTPPVRSPDTSMESLAHRVSELRWESGEDFSSEEYYTDAYSDSDSEFVLTRPRARSSESAELGAGSTHGRGSHAGAGKPASRLRDLFRGKGDGRSPHTPLSAIFDVEVPNKPLARPAPGDPTAGKVRIAEEARGAGRAREKRKKDNYLTCSKLTANWVDMESEILRQESEGATGGALDSRSLRWNSFNRQATTRSNRARLLMSSVPRNEHPKKLFRLDTLNDLMEDHKMAVQQQDSAPPTTAPFSTLPLDEEDEEEEEDEDDDEDMEGDDMEGDQDDHEGGDFHHPSKPYPPTQRPTRQGKKQRPQSSQAIRPVPGPPPALSSSSATATPNDPKRSSKISPRRPQKGMPTMASAEELLLPPHSPAWRRVYEKRHSVEGPSPMRQSNDRSPRLRVGATSPPPPSTLPPEEAPLSPPYSPGSPSSGEEDSGLTSATLLRHAGLSDSKGPRKKKRRHFLWLRKSHSNTIETDLLERGRTILNDIRIDTNPYQTRAVFIESVQAKSTLWARLGTPAQAYREQMLFPLFEADDSPDNVRYLPTASTASAPHPETPGASSSSSSSTMGEPTTPLPPPSPSPSSPCPSGEGGTRQGQGGTRQGQGGTRQGQGGTRQGQGPPLEVIPSSHEEARGTSEHGEASPVSSSLSSTLPRHTNDDGCGGPGGDWEEGEDSTPSSSSRPGSQRGSRREQRSQPTKRKRRRAAQRQSLQYCTIPKLIQHLLRYESTPDAHFISIFLLSYRTLLRPPELMELLIYRAFGTPAGAARRAQWTARSKGMQEKVLQFLCNWVELCFPYDFADDSHMMYMLAHLLYFLDAQSIYKTILMRTVGSRTTKGFIQWAHYSKKKKPPKPYIPKNLKKAKKIILQNINPTEIARQLALVEFDIFCSINPQEFSNQNWCGQAKEKRAPNILRMIAQFNSISNWVASEILRETSVKQRAVLLHRFIIIAEESRALRNYNAVMAILSGLQSAPIYRLKRTWSLLPDRSWDIWDDLNALMNNENNFSLYRKVVRTSRPPRVPYIGVYLTDMVFIEDSHPDYLPHTDLANVMKLEYMASVLFVLEGCKKGAYDLTPVPALQACLLATPSLSEEEQRQQSLLLEPLD